MGELIPYNFTQHVEDQLHHEQTHFRIEAELSEVRYLLAQRDIEGRYPDLVLQNVLHNLITDGYEAAVPHGITHTEQVYEQNDYYWMNESSLELARRGYEYHRHPFAKQRVAVEIEEAKDSRDNLQPGWAKVTISPRASRSDASYEAAKAEQLHDRDIVRIQYLKQDAEGRRVKVIESVQVFDVPLDAWVALLEDSNNLFQRPIYIEDSQSALAVLQTHNKTYVPLDRLPEGPLSVVKAVQNYLQDVRLAAHVEQQLEKFNTSQTELAFHAEHLAIQRLRFCVELADSIYQGKTTPYVTRWLEIHADQLSDQAKLLVQAKRINDGFEMSDEFALLASKINKSILWARLGVLVDNQDIVNWLPASLVETIHREHVFVTNNNFSWQQQLGIEGGSNQQLANSNLRIGGACSAVVEELFGQDKAAGIKEALSELFGPSEQAYKFNRRMYCEVCQKKPKKEDKKKMCGPCGICQTCDIKLRKATTKTA